MRRRSTDRPHSLSLAHPPLCRPEARFIYMPADRVIEESLKQNAVLYDVPNGEHTHNGISARSTTS